MELEVTVILCQGSDADSVMTWWDVLDTWAPVERDGSESILKAQSTLNKQIY